MTKHISITLAALVVLVLSAVSVTAAPAGTTCVSPVNAYANVRNTPGMVSTIVATLPAGRQAPVDSQANGWWHLAGGNYVSASVVSAGDCPMPTFTPTSAATRTPEPTWTAMPTPEPLLIRSDGTPLICTEVYTWHAGDDWFLALNCRPVHPLPTPTRIVP